MRRVWFSHCFLFILIPLLASGETLVGGPVEGVWTPDGNPYVVQSSISILHNTSLLIQPGVVVIFNNPDSIEVYGSLVAAGTVEDSICFSDSGKAVWRGVWFFNGSNNCILEYVAIDHPQWGIRAEYSTPIIRYCHVQAQSVGVGGHFADFTLMNSIVSVDALEANVIRLIHSDAHISGCYLYATPTSTSSPVNVFGVNIMQSDPDIRYSIIKVMAGGLACGIWAEESYKSNIYRNLVMAGSENLAFGASLMLSSPTISNNTIVITSGVNAKCIYLIQDADPIIENCILYGNGTSEGVYALNGSNPVINYSDLYKHMQNAVGCTTGVGNISEEPLFVNPLGGNYWLTAHSPCVDAGNPSSPPDPDGTIADMGCYYYDQSVPVEPLAPNVPQMQFVLLDAFPNPFNGQTQIRLDLPFPQSGQLLIYNQQGSLMNGIQIGTFPAGESRFIWNAAEMSSGIYWVVLRTPLTLQTRQICLIK